LRALRKLSYQRMGEFCFGNCFLKTSKLTG
jgi:hypothetical protein